jgi:catechol 2,3-dioxygenase
MNVIAPETSIGLVRLSVSDLAASRTFYEESIGLTGVYGEDHGTLLLSVGDSPPLLELHSDRGAPAANRRRPGLFHVAILVPSRRDLSLALLRLAQSRWPLTGASDHLVSEALYLDDPDGLGIEIYRDRPRPDWTKDDQGQLKMATLPLDLRELAFELQGSKSPDDPIGPMVEGTRVGHVHLQASELRDTEAFWSGMLGFGVTTRGYPGALFVSAGGYHHHLGFNTWNSAGAEPPPRNALGLREFEVRLPDEVALADVIDRVQAAEITPEVVEDGIRLRDPNDIAVILRT